MIKDFFIWCLKSNIEVTALRVTRNISLSGKIAFHRRSYYLPEKIQVLSQ